MNIYQAIHSDYQEQRTIRLRDLKPATYRAYSGELVTIVAPAEKGRWKASNGWRYSDDGSLRGDGQQSVHDLRCIA